ncbi:MAG: hypothetical protein U0892_04760 [Pirellulales bacterium]
MAGKFLGARLVRSRLISTLSLFIIVLIASSSTTVAQDKGQDKLDEATTLKLDADTPAKLAEVIKLCEEAVKLGLDEDGEQIAKNLIAASAMDRAKQLVQQLPQLARNLNAVRRLKNDALADLEKAIEAAPDRAEAFLLAAQVHILPQPDVKAASEKLDKAIELLKDKPAEQSAAYLLRARLIRREDENDLRLEDAKLATEADPTNVQAWQLRIAIEASSGKFEEAYQHIQKLLEQDSENEFVVQASFEVLSQLKKFDELIALLSKQIEAKSDNGKLYFLRASAYIFKSAEDDDKMLLSKAKEDLDKALELNPRDASALIRRSQILFDLGELDQARRDVSDALLINPQAIEGIYMRSIIAGREKRYSDAIADLELLVRAFPDREAYVRQLASYYQLDDRPRLAIRLLDELLKQKKRNWAVLRQRGDAKLSVGEHAEAIRDYERALEILDSPKDAAANKADAEDDQAVLNDTDMKAEKAGVLNNLAWVLATSPKDDVRDGKRSVELGKRACELTEFKEAHILSTLAAGYAETGDFEKAREWSQKAVDAGTEDENEQLEQLKKELDNYKENKPWREEQKTEENKRQRKKTETIET